MTETAERQRGAARFGELARERRHLEERAEERMAALRETLDELRVLDREQRLLLWSVKLDRPTRRGRLVKVLAGWLGIGPGEHGRAVPESTPERARLRADLDWLARTLTERPTRGGVR